MKLKDRASFCMWYIMLVPCNDSFIVSFYSIPGRRLFLFGQPCSECIRWMFFPQKHPVRTKLDIFAFIALLKNVENNFGRLIFKTPLNPQSLLYLNSS